MSRFKYNIFIAIVALFLLGSGIYIYNTHYSHSNVTDEPDVILWYVEGDKLHDGFADIAKEFNSLKDSVGRKNITVITRGFVSNEAIEKALKKVEADDAPDMIACDVNEAALLYNRGYTVKCSPYLDEWTSAEFNEDFIECSTLNNQLITVPYAADVQMMVVNTDMISDAGKIGSIEKLCKLSKQYYKDNESAMFTIADYASFFKTAMAQLGENFDAVNPRYSDSKNSKSVYNLLAQTAYDRGLTVSDNPVADVVSGKIPCAIVSASDVMEKADKIKRNISVYPCPSMKNGEQVYLLDVEGICICKTDSNRQNASSEFIKWFTSKEINHKFISDSGYIPAVSDMSTFSSDYQAFDKVRKVINSLSSKSEHAVYPPSVDYAKNYNEFINIMQLVMDSLS